MPPLSIEGWRKAKNLGTFEIVEVKNRSPFRNSATGGYHIADAGPASFVSSFRPMLPFADGACFNMGKHSLQCVLPSYIGRS